MSSPSSGNTQKFLIKQLQGPPPRPAVEQVRGNGNQAEKYKYFIFNLTFGNIFLKVR